MTAPCQTAWIGEVENCWEPASVVVYVRTGAEARNAAAALLDIPSDEIDDESPTVYRAPAFDGLNGRPRELTWKQLREGWFFDGGDLIHEQPAGRREFWLGRACTQRESRVDWWPADVWVSVRGVPYRSPWDWLRQVEERLAAQQAAS